MLPFLSHTFLAALLVGVYLSMQTDGDKEERLRLFELICQLGNEDEEASGMERDARSMTI